MGYPKKRNLDGYYFRVEREGKFENVCFTDLTEEEREKICEKKDYDWLRFFVLHLSRIIRVVGDELDIEFEEVNT